MGIRTKIFLILLFTAVSSYSYLKTTLLNPGISKTYSSKQRVLNFKRNERLPHYASSNKESITYTSRNFNNLNLDLYDDDDDFKHQTHTIKERFSYKSQNILTLSNQFQTKSCKNSREEFSTAETSPIFLTTRKLLI